MATRRAVGAHFKFPCHVMFVDELPMTVTGKAQKYKMRDRTMAELGISDGPFG